jgi:hypothetical protein
MRLFMPARYSAESCRLEVGWRSVTGRHVPHRDKKAPTLLGVGAMHCPKGSSQSYLKWNWNSTPYIRGGVNVIV